MNWVLELDRGRYYIYESNYSGYLEKKAKRLEQEEREEQGKQKAIKDELDWIRRSPKARQAKSKARIRAFDELVEAQENRTPGKAQILIQVPERLGGNVIDAKGVSKAYGDKLLFDDLSFSLPPGGIVGVIGPNGAGKTTLFKLITGAGAARRRRDQDRRRRCISAMSTSRATHLEPEQERLGGDFGRARRLPLRQARDRHPRLCRRLQLQAARTSRRRSASSRAASATASTWPRC